MSHDLVGQASRGDGAMAGRAGRQVQSERASKKIIFCGASPRCEQKASDFESRQQLRADEIVATS